MEPSGTLRPVMGLIYLYLYVTQTLPRDDISPNICLHFVFSPAPRVSVQYTAFNVRVLLTIFKTVLEFFLFPDPRHN